MAEVLLVQVQLYLLHDIGVLHALVDHLFEVYFPVVKQAYLQVAVCSQTYAVAATTEVVSHGADKAHGARVARDLVDLRGRRQVVKLNVLQLKVGLTHTEPLIDDIFLLETWDEFVVSPLVLVERHVFNEPYLHLPLLHKVNEI